MLRIYIHEYTYMYPKILLTIPGVIQLCKQGFEGAYNRRGALHNLGGGGEGYNQGGS